MSLVWTRALADWSDDQALLSGRTDLVRVPCVRLVTLAPAFDFKQFNVYVAASAHVFEHLSLTPGARIHVFGDATESAARQRGFAVVRHQGVRTAADWAPRLAAVLDQNQSVGVLSAAVPAFDLSAALRAAGIDATSIACYRTEAGAHKIDGSPFTDAEARDFGARLRGVVCFASPSAVEGFCAVFPSGSLAAVCIGPTTAKAAAAHFVRTATAAQNSLASLIDAASQLQV